jgi:zinc transport system substrate-binding protein
MQRRLSTLATLGVLGLAAGACATDSAADGNASLDIVAAFYPLEFVVNRVGGDHVAVAGLAPPGVEAHDLELTPSQVADIARADLVVFLGGFQPAVDDAVAAHADGTGLDVAGLVPLIEATGDGGHEHGTEPGHEETEPGHEEGAPAGPGGRDPHVWLDPDRLATIADALAAALGERDPAHAADYTANAEALGEELAALDAEYARGLADCQRREIVVSHAAFGYLADRYDLEQIAVTGLSPEEEPGPQRLAEVIHEAETHGATTIFFEVLVSPEVAELIANQVGASTAVLDPIEGLAPDRGDDYFSLMRTNLDALRTALDCA